MSEQAATPVNIALSDSQRMTPAAELPDIDLKESRQLPVIQRKLTVGAVDDPLEDEADQMADKVMRMPEPSFVQRKSADDEEEATARRKPVASFIQKKSAHGGAEENSLAGKPLTSFIQRKEVDGASAVADAATENYIGSLNGKGKSLTSEEKRFFEPRFGYDFSNVQLHTDADASQSAQSINAFAYTSGNNIVFNNGRYSPETAEGKRLMGHELTHVVQQNNSNANAGKIMRDGPSDPPTRVRIPILETTAMQFGSLGSASRPLSAERIATARSIFGNSIIYSAVRIVTSSIIAAPTTLGNNIRIPPNYALDNATLIHELTHIWQYQNRGAGYISDSLTHQLAGILGTGDRDAAYAYTIVPGRAFEHYTAEQQAMIVEDYYRQPDKRNDPEYQRLIAQVQSATPSLPTDIDRYSESLYGPSYRNDRIFDTPGPSGSDSRGGGTAPLFRVEF